MATWLIPRDEMTPEQLRAIEFSPQEHRVIFGAPGSGKTQIILHRARHLIDTLNLSDGQYHIFVFTNVLKEYIKSALKLLDIPESAVSTLDGWCMNYFRTSIRGTMPKDPEGKRPDFTAIRRAVLEHVRASKAPPRFGFVLVDEGQDLDDASFELLTALGRHVTVCMDHKQRIYEGGTDEAAVLKKLGLKRRNMALLEAYRCSPYIVELAAHYVDDAAERAAYVNQAKTMSTNIETPLLFIADDFEAEMERLVDILKTRLTTDGTIGILVPQKRQVFGIAERFRELGFQVEHQGDREQELNFSNRLPKVMTYHSAKGLTFDTVLLPRLVGRSFSNVPDERVRRLLFVGVTRATKWVYMSTQAEKEAGAIASLLGASGPRRLTVQRGAAMTSSVPAATPSPRQEESLLDLL